MVFNDISASLKTDKLTKRNTLMNINVALCLDNCIDDQISIKQLIGLVHLSIFYDLLIIFCLLSFNKKFKF